MNTNLAPNGNVNQTRSRTRSKHSKIRVQTLCRTVKTVSRTVRSTLSASTSPLPPDDGGGRRYLLMPTGASMTLEEALSLNRVGRAQTSPTTTSLQELSQPESALKSCQETVRLASSSNHKRIAMKSPWTERIVHCNDSCVDLVSIRSFIRHPNRRSGLSSKWFRQSPA